MTWWYISILLFCVTGTVTTDYEGTKEVARYTVRNDFGAEMTVTNFGCTLLSFKLDGRELTLNYGDPAITAEDHARLNQVRKHLFFFVFGNHLYMYVCRDNHTTVENNFFSTCCLFGWCGRHAMVQSQAVLPTVSVKANSVSMALTIRWQPTTVRTTSTVDRRAFTAECGTPNLYWTKHPGGVAE